MRVETGLGVLAFVGCALGVSLGNGCGLDCECPEFPLIPKETAVLMPLQIRGTHPLDSGPPLAVMPDTGSLQVTGDTVVVEYQQGGVHHRVVYEVLPRR